MDHADCICQRVNAESLVDGKHAIWIDGVQYRPVAEVRADVAAEIRNHPNASTFAGRFIFEDCAVIAEGTDDA